MEPNEALTVLTASTSSAPSPVPAPRPEDAEWKHQICRILGVSDRGLRLIRCLDALGMTEDDCRKFLLVCRQVDEKKLDYLDKCGPLLTRCNTLCDEMEARCMSHEQLVIKHCCPANNVFGVMSRHQWSDNGHITLDTVVEDYKTGYNNAFPVAPNQMIRLEHPGRPGFYPTNIDVKLTFDNDGTNYDSIELQFYVGPGGKEEGHKVGSAYRGSQFLDADGRSRNPLLPFPKWLGKPVDIGSLEKISVDITHKGPINNLVSATIFIYHDAECYAKFCVEQNVCK